MKSLALRQNDDADECATEANIFAVWDYHDVLKLGQLSNWGDHDHQ
jgi:hypothetical protein